MKKLKVGLVGLPNVGKSTFFELLTKKNTLIANYPFSTIEPSAGIVEMQDSRVLKLGNIFKSKKLVFDNFELIDIAGIVKGASQKIGLGGEFLSQIRNVNIIIHMVRCFNDESIIHVEGNVNSVRDLSLIKLELILSDIQQIEKRIEKIKFLLKKNSNRDLEEELLVLEKIEKSLEKEIAISEIEAIAENELKIIEKHNFLSAKRSLVIANYSDGSKTEINRLIENYPKMQLFEVEGKNENDFKSLSIDEQKEIGWNSFDQEKLFELIKNICGLKTFFTAGISETKAWSIESKATAVECAGLIHSDIKNRFIKCEVYNIDQISESNLHLLTKENRKESASYVVKEGDVCNFLFNK